MGWLLLAVAILVLLWLASVGRKARQREAVSRLRAHFPHIARLRLVAACRQLDGVLSEADLRLLFDWMLIELHRRTGTSSLGELMQWSIERGAEETTKLTADVSRQAVDKLPSPVLAAIDDCEGREYAAVILDQSLTEAGERIGPQLNRK